MKLDMVDRIIIDEFKIFGDAKHPGCSSRQHNQKIYGTVQDLLIKRGVRMNVQQIEEQWKRLKKWWIEHQKRVPHGSYRGEKYGYECPRDSELCVRMAFISVCDCYRHLYANNQAAEAEHDRNIPLVIID